MTDNVTSTSSGPHGEGAPRAARVIAIYLPQFYPTPENDRWWGPGFTEWTNVASAKPQFRGHQQPRIPGELGFYDLRLAETRQEQADLAREHGVEAFCYWHYWSNGARLLDRPFGEVLSTGEPDFGFCLAWANGDWARTWTGKPELLHKQLYSPDDDLDHIRWLMEAFADQRYLRVGGRPVFLVYHIRQLPEPARTLDTWRTECVRAGLPEPLLLGIGSWTARVDSRTMGFDGTVDFEPQFGALRHDLGRGAGFSFRRFRRNLELRIPSSTLDIFDYEKARAAMKENLAGRDFPSDPMVLVAWDNTPRFGRNAVIMVNATPEAFERGLEEAIASVATKPFDERLVWVNAWNEWAEGNYLEPDRLVGRARLEALRRVVLGHRSTGSRRQDATVEVA